tara:strand:+ start:1037 stop:1141 length:105 start_codon:yes stop_codon:yes gene_type:complete
LAKLKNGLKLLCMRICVETAETADFKKTVETADI